MQAKEPDDVFAVAMTGRRFIAASAVRNVASPPLSMKTGEGDKGDLPFLAVLHR